MKKFLLAVLLAGMLTGCVTIEESETTELTPEEDGVDITVIRGLAYELLFDSVYYQGVLGEEYDINAEIDEMVERHNMSEIDEMELCAMVDVLAELYGLESEEESVPEGVFNEAEVISQLDVTEYSFSNEFWNYHFLVIKNNSDYTLEISAATKYYDASGNLVGAKDDDECAVGSGSEICLYFMPDEKYATSEYELSVQEDKWYESVVGDLTYESVPAKEKEIVSVTNNGYEPAEFVEVYALFFNGDEPVYFNTEYFTDDDSELKPGKTITEELDCYEDYTSVRFFLTGRRDNW